MGRWIVNTENSGSVGDWPSISALLSFTNSSYLSFSASTSSADYANAVIVNMNTSEVVKSAVFALNTSAQTFAVSLELDVNSYYSANINKVR